MGSDQFISAWDTVRNQHQAQLGLSLYHAAYSRYSAAILLTLAKTHLWEMLQGARQIHIEGLLSIYELVAKVFFDNSCPGGQMPLLLEDASYASYFERTWPRYWYDVTERLLNEDAFIRWVLEMAVDSSAKTRNASMRNALEYVYNQVNIVLTIGNEE